MAATARTGIYARLAQTGVRACAHRAWYFFLLLLCSTYFLLAYTFILLHVSLSLSPLSLSLLSLSPSPSLYGELLFFTSYHAVVNCLPRTFALSVLHFFLSEETRYNRIKVFTWHSFTS